MAVAGLPEPRPDHAAIALKLGKGLLKIMDLFNEKYGTELQIRIGLNTGPVVAGVIGKRKFSYDLWGDAVNVASRMESNGIPGRIHVSQSTYDLLKDTHAFDSRGTIEIKGKGPMNTYLYSGKQ
jgi:class 3 adenylate cyclase